MIASSQGEGKCSAAMQLQAVDDQEPLSVRNWPLLTEQLARLCLAVTLFSQVATKLISSGETLERRIPLTQSASDINLSTLPDQVLWQSICRDQDVGHIDLCLRAYS